MTTVCLFFQAKTAYGMPSLVGSEKCIRDRYIEMTLSLLKELCVSCFLNGNTIEINPNVNLAGNIGVEADLSAAAFWYEAVSVIPNIPVFLSGLKKEPIQGDGKVAVSKTHLTRPRTYTV